MVCPPARDAVEAVSFSVDPGGVLVLSEDEPVPRARLMPVLATAVAPVAGRVRIGGVDAALEPGSARAQLGWVDAVAMDPAEIVQARIQRLARWSGAERAALDAARDALRTWLPEPVGRLAPAARIRVALETARLHRPGLLLLERPLERLGASARPPLQDRLASLAAEGVALVLADASAEARELADTVLDPTPPSWIVAAAFDGSIAAHEAAARDQGWDLRWRVGRQAGSVRIGPFADAASAAAALQWLLQRQPAPRSARIEPGHR